jgi:hypothetical protein
MLPPFVLGWASVQRHPITGELFLRIVGRRRDADPGQVPSRATRDALAEMAHYRTRAPKGVFIYASHEAANAMRDAWTVDAIVATQR